VGCIPSTCRAFSSAKRQRVLDVNNRSIRRIAPSDPGPGGPSSTESLQKSSPMSRLLPDPDPENAIFRAGGQVPHHVPDTLAISR